MQKICKVCFKEFDYQGINNYKVCICKNCFNELDVIFKTIYINSIKTLIIYNYDDYFKNILYLFKGCYDYQMKDVFLSRFLIELKIRYHNFIIVPMPSNKEDDEIRGFNHVVEIFGSLGLEMDMVLYKNKYFKQSERNKDERELVSRDLEIKKVNRLKNRKVLLVDDVITTGSSIKAAIKLVKNYNPKKIEVLSMSKKVKNS